jgi:hypothetical protein
MIGVINRTYIGKHIMCIYNYFEVIYISIKPNKHYKARKKQVQIIRIKHNKMKSIKKKYN